MTTHFLFFPGGPPGQRSLAGYSPCGLKESDTTEVTYHMHARDILCLLIWQETASVLAQSVKSPPAMQETHVRVLGWEDPLEKEMATHFSILAWKIPWTDKPGGLQTMGSQRVGHD